MKALILLIGLLLIGCGPDDEGNPKLTVNVFGWGPNIEGTNGFVQGMPVYESAETVRIKLTQPKDGRVLSNSSFGIFDGAGRLPEVSFGENLRMDIEILSAQQVVLAAGSTPMFDFDSGTPWRAYRMMVSPINAFSPVGSLVADSQTGEQKLAQSRYDYRGFNPGEGVRNWLGRVGHVAVPADGGRVLIVGGGDPTAFPGPAAMPNMRATYGDVQIFDPGTGYFTDLSMDDAATALNVVGVDRLARSRAYHTVTPLGQGRYLVTGGLTVSDGRVRAVNTIELIDLNAPAGTRIQQIANAEGTPAILRNQRAMHSATYRADDRSVVVAGGIDSEGEVVDTFEVIHVPSGTVPMNPGLMQSPRVGHSAVLSTDGRRVWLLGGRTDTNVLSSTEVLEYNGETTSSVRSISLNRARFGATLLRLSTGNGHDVMIAGGFTSLAGDVASSYEIGGLQRGAFFQESGYRLQTARGGASAVELPHSRDILIIGGLDASGDIAPHAERLVYRGFDAAVPYEAAEGIGGFDKPRYGASVTAMDTGFILVTGGTAMDASSFDNSEYFNPLDPVRPRSSQ